MTYPAHIEGERIQTVEEHCRNGAGIAGDCLKDIGLDKLGYLVGLLHDMGKFTDAFKNYIERAAAGKKVQVGSVIHSHGGAKYILETKHTKGKAKTFQDMTAELVAYAVGAHHGLFDGVNDSGEWGFARREAWDEKLYSQAKALFLERCAGEEELDRLFWEAHSQAGPVYQWVNEQGENERIFFMLGILARLTLSAVIEGDRRDTADYKRGYKSQITRRLEKEQWDEMLHRMEKKLQELNKETAVQKARGQISQICFEAAKGRPGIYRMNVPTGGGKTLSSLRYALAHAGKYDKSRIIYVMPLLAIIEQNSQVIRDYIQDDSLVLEHHSNVIRDGEETDELDPWELMAESWNAPVIITTLVQFLNTLFDGRTSCIRRFQALCNSVIIIDEVQTVPVHMLSMFDLALDFLAQVCKATVILCSATQPCLEAAQRPPRTPIGDIVPHDPELWKVFRRTEMKYAGAMKLEDVPPVLIQALEDSQSLLVVCNLKSQAKYLFEKLKRPGVRCFHLSASMCQAHRKRVIAEIEEALEKSKEGGEKVLCVSTQVIEAGVDISFSQAARLLAGMDNAVQVAGRCNRHGEIPGLAQVLLIDCADDGLVKLRAMKESRDAARKLICAYIEDEKRFGDLASDASIEYYYRMLFQGNTPRQQDYVTADGTNIFDLLSVNDQYHHKEEKGRPYYLNQALATAGRLFEVLDQETTSVFVPFGEGKGLIYKLRNERDFKRQEELMEKLKPYTVSLFQYQLKNIWSQGGLLEIGEGGPLELKPGWYDENVGVIYKADNIDEHII